jgi:2-keto-4-pentenoate hydratase/2-oxohepta-3-ene-1,7-dioic acid hydratase in catechol pathway
MKPSTAVIGPNESIVYPVDGEIIHFEGELCAVIGKTARHVPEARALDYVLGYTCGNDVSDRVLQRRESAFGCLFAGKGYDTFAPLGPAIVTGLDPSNLSIITRVNGQVRQNGNTADLLFPVPYLIAYLSRYLTLLPGDVIMTGTPAGVGPISVGDSIEIEIGSIGVLRNDVVAEAPVGARRA